jgi:hypothetical protein
VRECREGQITKAAAGGFQKITAMREGSIHEVR